MKKEEIKVQSTRSGAQYVRPSDVVFPVKTEDVKMVNNAISSQTKSRPESQPESESKSKLEEKLQSAPDWRVLVVACVIVDLMMWWGWKKGK